MARVESGLLSALSGKMGDIVVYHRGGKTYVRSAPKPSKKKPTKQQSEARLRFAALRKLIRVFAPALMIGYREQLSQKMLHCVAFSELWAHGVVGDAPECAIDYGRVVVSNGYCPAAENVVCERVGDQLVARWDAAVTTQSQAADEVYLAAYNADTNEFKLSQPVMRKARKATLDVADGQLHCYVFVASATNNKTSRSQYFCL